MAHNAETQMACLSWCAHDVLTIRPTWTEAQALEWLEHNARYIRDRLCELGWQVMEDLMPAYDLDEELLTAMDIESETQLINDMEAELNTEES